MRTRRISMAIICVACLSATTAFAADAIETLRGGQTLMPVKVYMVYNGHLKLQVPEVL